jgi:hypothetical protein
MLGEKKGGVGGEKKEKRPNKIMDLAAKSLKLGAITGETEQQEKVQNPSTDVSEANNTVLNRETKDNFDKRNPTKQN